MADLPLTLTCGGYARVMPLANRTVKPDGIDLTLVTGADGSWAGRAEMLQRALNDPAAAGGEASMMVHLARIDRGDRSVVALPIFPLRNFTARDLYIRRGGPITKPADLAGKRFGMYGWSNSGSVWYRHFMAHLGLDIHGVEWVIGPVDEPKPTTSTAVLPAHVKATPPGKSLSDLLIAGEIDALWSPPRPKRYHPTEGPIARLFPDYRGIEREYYRQTRAYPPQHLMVVRRAAWDANPWIGKALVQAFNAAEEAFVAGQRGFPYATPWFEAELDDSIALMGPDWHANGFEKTRHLMELFCRQAHAGRLTERLVTPEEYFQEFLAS